MAAAFGISIIISALGAFFCLCDSAAGSLGIFPFLSGDSWIELEIYKYMIEKTALFSEKWPVVK